jgi:FkbM family methyltransferase
MHPPLTVIDVGARWGVSAQWAALGPDRRIVGFDPDPEECERLNTAAAAAGDPVTYVPLALGATTRSATLYITREPACSSLYRPLASLAEVLPELACITEVGRSSVAVATLDAWCADNDVTLVDMIKLDTQGSELGVLEGAERTLEHVQLLEVEVEFNPIYEGQPLFGDIDAYLRQRGFVLWKLDYLVHYSAGDPAGAVDTVTTTYYDSVQHSGPGRGGQLFWGQAYYTRAELCPGASRGVPAEQARRAAAVASAIGLADLALSAAALSTG